MKKLVRVRTRISGFFIRRCKTRIRVRSPPLQSNPAYNSISRASNKTDRLCDDNSWSKSQQHNDEEDGDTPRTKAGKNNGNRILVLIDSTKEAKGALNWALTHTVQKEDTVILLHVAKPSKTVSDYQGNVDPRAYGLLYSMKTVCQTKRPGVKVEAVVLRGKDKGPLVVEEAKQQKASLLVIGHKRRTVAWRFLMRWTGNNSSCAVADYCIQHADCMTIAVRRKSRKLGGYLITTKRHKNFWLLA